MAATDGSRAVELAFSPKGRHLAYALARGQTGSAPSEVAWVAVDEPGEIGRLPGMSFAWTPKSASLVVADVKQGLVVRRALSTGRPQPLAKIEDDGDPSFLPSIAVSPDGRRVAFTSRRVTDAVTEVWIARRQGRRASRELLTEIPGASIQVRPFWSPKGVTLAMLIVHLEQEKSAIIAVPKLQGGGVVLHENDLLDVPESPAWAPSGRTIAYFGVDQPHHEFTKSGPPRLMLLDVHDRDAPAQVAVTQPDELAGRPHFLDEQRLAIDGSDRAHVLTFDRPL
jgi:dipeptidyl aminopeptidase/acylaminoacyl peptidase